jgi:hypothetical protein
MRVRLRNIGVGVLAGLTVCTAGWFLGGKRWLEHIVNDEMVKPWVVFDVPKRTIPLDTEIYRKKDGIAVCNRGDKKWSSVLLRAHSVYNGLESEWVAELSEVKSSACATVPLSKFYEPSWKKIPASPQLTISKVEVLATVAARGYANQSLATSPQ